MLNAPGIDHLSEEQKHWQGPVPGMHVHCGYHSYYDYRKHLTLFQSNCIKLFAMRWYMHAQFSSHSALKRQQHWIGLVLRLEAISYARSNGKAWMSVILYLTTRVLLPSRVVEFYSSQSSCTRDWIWAGLVPTEWTGKSNESDPADILKPCTNCVTTVYFVKND